MTLRRPAFLLIPTLILAAFLVIACSDDNGNGGVPADEDEVPGLGQGGPGETSLEIAAEDNEFDKDELRAPAMSRVVLELENRDAGVLHNLSIYRSSDARNPIFIGDLFLGVETREFEFETPAAGKYFFRCDVHPDMTGTFTVE